MVAAANPVLVLPAGSVPSPIRHPFASATHPRRDPAGFRGEHVFQDQVGSTGPRGPLLRRPAA
ncbi:hypothetical protein HBB16_05540 [Pseudonocardia sp. MCCB 268]|nr:hypothetical protein [Pseudonocardia cytotoxica]